MTMTKKTLHNSNADYATDYVLEHTLSEIKVSERMLALQIKQITRKGILPVVTEYCPSVPDLKNILIRKSASAKENL